MNRAHVDARLLTAEAAAVYLSLPVAAVRRLAAGRVVLDGRARWDRLALDAWLDERFRPAPAALPANENASEADLALARFLEAQPDAARRSPG